MYKKIEEVICRELDITPDELTSGCRKHRFAFVRMIVSKLMRDERYSLNDIGRLLNKDHTTILYYLGRYDDMYKYDKKFRGIADKITMLINS